MKKLCLFCQNTKNVRQFGHGVRKGGLVNTVPASFNTITGQMTEMPQGKKQCPTLELSCNSLCGPLT